MSIVDLLIYVFACAGTTILIVSGQVFEPFRSFISKRSERMGYLINCPMCFGFWVGLALSFGFDISPLYGAVISSLFSWAISNVVDAFNVIGIYYDGLLEDGESENERKS